jgi:F1F0 ATPase subunit 2
MNDTLILALAAGAGVVFGTIFFGGLWWTVRRGLSSKRPALWFFVSLLLRMGITMAGFYLISGGRGERLVACLVGFLLARFVVTRLARAPIEQHRTEAKEAGHAS